MLTTYFVLYSYTWYPSIHIMQTRVVKQPPLFCHGASEAPRENTERKAYGEAVCWDEQW